MSKGVATRYGRRKQVTGPSVFSETGVGFVVTGLPGASPVFRSRAKAEAWIAEQEAKLPKTRQRRERACMCCGRDFMSDGAHNRLCDGCRKADGGPVPMGIMRPRRRGDGAVR